MKLFVGLWLVFCTCCNFARAETLAVICTAGGAKGGSPNACSAVKYDVPKPTDLVRKGTGWTDFVLAPFGELLPSEPLNACTTSGLSAGLVPPWPYAATDPCKDFTSVPASTFGTLPILQLYWTAPSLNVDGTPLTDLAGFRIIYGKTANALDQTIEIKNPAASSYVVTGLSYSTTYFVAIKAFTTKDVESDKSNTFSGVTVGKPAEPTKPQPPVLTVKELTAYDLTKANDKLTLSVIGTVPADTKCLAAVRAMDLYGVPRASVKLNPSIKTRPQVVLAKCA